MNINNKSIKNDIEPIQEAQQLRGRKKCHGNRSDQRFRRSCRKHNMSETVITQLIEQRRNSRMRNRAGQMRDNPANNQMQHDSSTISALTMQVSKSHIGRY